MDTAVDLTLAIPGYCLGEELYYGSRTVVYWELREADRQPVIIKLLRRDYPTFDLLEFRNQYATAKNLEIPGIVRFYSMELYRGGMISVNSVPKQGTEFTITIPVKAKVENSNVLVETEVFHVPS
ncbi:hypothetical protein [Fischerella sp. JS2]|uniref:hypothetical protein n=1 Tax=Fischerella sp. JS2 TaxID=2597771 RepID=UPI0028EE8674|nr:hypothetical protein [Fischerella sp. JS2]